MVKLRHAKLRKKGLTQSQAVGLVAALALGILLLQFSKPFISTVQAQDIIEGCRLSVALSSWQLATNILVTKLSWIDSPFQLDCKTIFTEITETSINRADDKIKLSDDSNLAKEQLKEAIMRNMRECWYMFGEGKIKVEQAISVKDKQTSCIVCSEIILDNELIDVIMKDKNKAIKLENMYAYASTATIPPKDEKTYWEYFLENAETKPELAKLLNSNRIVTLDTLNRQYSVVFAVMSEEESAVGRLFGRDSLSKANDGIVDCYVGDRKVVDGGDAKDIGCDPSGTEPWLVFGKIGEGGTEIDYRNWKTAALGLAGSAPLNFKFKTYPMTVRLVPTSELKNYCKRLY